MVSHLHRKLLRDLRELKGPIATIGIVVAAGVAAYVCIAGTYRSLTVTRDRYYVQHRMAEVFGSVHRAPETLARRLEAIDGVERIATRLRAPVRVRMPDVETPPSGVIISIPREGEAALGALRLSRGRRPLASHADEVVVLEAFANAHDLAPGDRFELVLEGRERTVTIVGLANSPEYVLAMAPGALTVDAANYAVIFMPRPNMEPALDMRGAFNDLAITLQRGASSDEVIRQVDALLEPYGGHGAYARARQSSHFMLEGELTQLASMAESVPAIFLLVAAFLLNVVLSRVVALQRGQIATMKAVGYSDVEVGLHYLQLVLLIVWLGTALGLLLGAALGRSMTALYLQFFHLPTLRFRMPFDLAATAMLVSSAAGAVGAMSAVRRVIALPPAEAMRPEPPPIYRARASERFFQITDTLFGPTMRIVLREIRRRPIRLVFSVLGIALSMGMVVVGNVMSDSMDYLTQVYLHGTQREDVVVQFGGAIDAGALSRVRAIEGVHRVDGLRQLPVRFEAGHRHRTSALIGYPPDHDLRAIRESTGARVTLPEDGVMLTGKLADVLGVEVGDPVRVVPLDGARAPFTVSVTARVDEAMGMQGHMRTGALHAALSETPSVDSALLAVDERAFTRIRRTLEAMPAVASIARGDAALRAFREQSGGASLAMSLIITLFAAVITIGVVYNNARVTLSARQRDLGSLRVLGFTRGEISGVLLGELALQVALAMPLGLYVGHAMVSAMFQAVDQEVYRLPAIISARTFAIAVVVTAAAALLSALIVRRKLDTIDLIGVLKTRD